MYIKGKNLAFSESEKLALLEVKGVGITVISRLEEIGIDSFEKLSAHNVEEIVNRVASMLRTTCWKNSPQAKAAISAAIERARVG